VAVSHVFVDLRLVVVGLPLLLLHEVVGGNLLHLSPPSSHRLGKMSNEKLRSRLNLRRLHTWRSVPFLFVELQLWVVVVGLPPLSPPSFHGLGKMSKEKLHSCLNLTGTPHVAVPYALFLELQLRVVVVGLPLLAVYKVARADLGSIRTPLLASVRKENESGFDVL
jgi:hypothetical protein